MPYSFCIIFSCILTCGTVSKCGKYIYCKLTEIYIAREMTVRMISGSGFTDNADPLFTNPALIKFVDHKKYMLAKFLFRYYIYGVHHIFEGYFSRISDIHGYGTRTNDAKHVESDLGKTYSIQRTTCFEHDYRYWYQYWCFRSRKHCPFIFCLLNVQSRCGYISSTFHIMFYMMKYLSVSYCIIVVITFLHTLHICNHQNHDLWSISSYGAHKPLGFLVLFAIISCYGSAIVDSHVCFCYPHICTWPV